MIDRPTLTTDLARQVTALEDDLRARTDRVERMATVVEREWASAVEAGRTAHDLPTWRESLFTQVAVAWVLATTFVRFCEDNGLVDQPLLSGPGARRRRAEDAQTAWFRQHPAEGERGYVLSVLREAARLPGLSHVLAPSNPVWLFDDDTTLAPGERGGPSDDQVRALLTFWRAVDAETGALRHDFTDDSWSTRFLGDLYQDLSASARAEYALLQTPGFVEEFILDRTLDPAIDEFGLTGFRMIDPACGSGHFLLGAFDRLVHRWSERSPEDGARAHARYALESVHGIDLNPAAAAIARFRLLVAALRASGEKRLADAPNFPINVAVGDSLRHGPPPRQQTLEIYEQHDDGSQHAYATEDREAVHRMLAVDHRYHAVVANPPYITPKDPAANQRYRDRYTTCHRQYSLAVPFMERLFDLAIRGGDGTPAGFVGQITANSFMKREFGKPLIEKFLANQVDLTHVIDTESLNVGGHGTATVIIFGRNCPPSTGHVRAVLGIQGDREARSEPESSQVWTSIRRLIDAPGSENKFVSVADLSRTRLVRHPWSLGGGAAGPLRERVESMGTGQLSANCKLIGYTGQTNADDVMLGPSSAFKRKGVEPRTVTTMAVGDLLRDWVFTPEPATLFPYDEGQLLPLGQIPRMHRWLWPARTNLEARRTFAKKSYKEEGRPWWEWHQVALDRLTTPLSIAFPFVATHNHFVLHCGGAVFKQTAPAIKLPAEATTDDHLRILGLLNSSTACFWMKQVFYSKGSGGVNEGFKAENWERFREFDGTKLKQFPIPAGSALPWGQALDSQARELAATLPTAIAERSVPSLVELKEAHIRADSIRARMVSDQEELDWRCLHLYGVTSEDLSLAPGEAPPLARGERAFEIVLTRRIAAGEVQSSWFVRHGSTPITELPGHWPEDYRRLVEQRIELIENDRFVGLVERPEHKRRWNWESWDDLEKAALKSWLLDRLEDPRYWPELRPRSAAQLADDARGDADFVQVAELYAGRVDVDLTELVSSLVADEAVAYLSAWRYTDPGLRKRQAWERTWELQRREDAGEAVGDIPVPPKYAKADFATGAGWRLRGKLDVPKERFVLYPGAGKETDPTPLVGWAGWDHLQSAHALAALYEERRAKDGWNPEQLRPLLAGLAELVPWLKQWHNDHDPAMGTRLGDFYEDFVADEAHAQGFSTDDLATWRPPAKKRGRRAKATPTTSEST